MSPIVAAVRMEPVLGDRAESIARGLAGAAEAVAAGAEVVVLPELCTSGYCFASEAEADAACEPVPGEATAAWHAFAREHGAVVVAGLAERLDAGGRANSAVVVDRDGVRAVYRKAHLWDTEKLWFAEGADLPPVVATSAGMIGVGVCYDLWFPELVRSLADRGAELLAFPSNLTDDPPVVVRDHAYTAVARAAAHINRVPLVLADRCGAERGATWVGAAVVVDADGRLVAAPDRDDDRPAVVVGDLPPLAPRAAALGERNDLVGDRRDDLFGGGAAIALHPPTC